MENNMNVLNMGVETEGTSARARGKQKILLIATALICLAVLAGGTLAYFTAEETAYNVITTGILSMDLVEETTGGQPWPDGGVSGVTPGMEIDKVPYVKNDGGVDFYVRMSVATKVTGANGKLLDTKYVTMNIDAEKWTEKDGYYYYNGIVKPGEKSAPLFTVVKIDEDMDNAYMNAQIEIEVTAQAVQSKNNGTDALSATGWKAN